MRKFSEEKLRQFLLKKPSISSQEVLSELLKETESDSKLLVDLYWMETLGLYALQTHQSLSFLSFCLYHTEHGNFQCPWTLFLECLATEFPNMDENQKNTLLLAITENNAEAEAGRSPSIHKPLPLAIKWNTERKYALLKKYKEQKKDLLEQLKTFEIQGLSDKEALLLQKLLKLYPGDLDIQKKIQEKKQKQAFETLARYQSKISENKNKEAFRELQATASNTKEDIQYLAESFHKESQKNPKNSYDMSIACYFLEDYQGALEIILENPKTPSEKWLEVELYLKLKRWLEALESLNSLEKEFASNSETFFSAAYLRSQAFWGLGQKSLAIETLENLLLTRGDFRSASSLLDFWRQSK